VDIDQSGHDVEAVHVHDLENLRRIDVRSHRGDLAVANRDVAHAIDFIFPIDDVPAFEEQIVWWLSAEKTA
jgi:hypothetical protein